MKWTALLFLSLAFAGCAENSAPPEVDDPDAVLNDPDQYYADHYCIQNELPHVLAPDANGFPWKLGDYWEYNLIVDGENLGRTKLTYYDDQDFDSEGQPRHYMVGTPTRDEALHNALFGSNPVIGRVHRLLYSPHESGSHADMFNFPLCEGNSWTTRFYDTVFTYTAREDNGAYRIDGRASDGSTATHTFDPETKWFTKIHVNRADGFTVKIDLVDSGSGPVPDAYFLRGQKDETYDIGKLTPNFLFERNAGAEGAYDTVGLHLDFARDGENRVELFVTDPDGQEVACVGYSGGGLQGGETACAAPGTVFEVPFVEGDWRLEARQFGLSRSELSGESRVTSIYDRSSTN